MELPVLSLFLGGWSAFGGVLIALTPLYANPFALIGLMVVFDCVCDAARKQVESPASFRCMMRSRWGTKLGCQGCWDVHRAAVDVEGE